MTEVPNPRELIGPLPRELAGWIAGNPPSGQRQETIYQAYRSAILSGELPAHTRIASTRELAALLSVARSTVQLAFERLIDEGFTQAAAGRGTEVAALPTGDFDRVSATPMIATTHGAPSLMPLAPGIPAIDLFPVDQWKRAYGVALSRGPSLLGYGEPAGHEPLRKAIIEHVRRTRGVNGSQENVIITDGAQSAIELIIAALCTPNDVVCLEDPGYLPFRSIVRRRATMVPIPVDDEGFDVAYARRTVSQPRAVLVSPSHQFPMGGRLSVTRRLELLRWIAHERGFVIEDDYDSEFRFGSAPFPAIQSLDRNGVVLYVGTFSKTLFPSLRLGYIIAPAALVEPIRRARREQTLSGTTLSQAALAEFMRSGDFGRHLRRMRRVYEQRRNAFIEALREFADPSLLMLKMTDTGLHLSASLSTRVRDRDVAREAYSRGISCWALSSFTVNAYANGFIFGFANCDEATTRDAVATFATIVAHHARALGIAR
jgi:GntR family transcriptional regulator/MocR family aminotransferase